MIGQSALPHIWEDLIFHQHLSESTKFCAGKFFRMFLKHYSVKAHCEYWVTAPRIVKSDSLGLCTHGHACIQVHLCVTVRSVERGLWFGHCHENTVMNT